MKKIVCPRCGAVNLDKFVTFPHCAGCSALLDTARMGGETPENIWRRPLRVGFWASLVGVALLGAVALSFSSVDKGEPAPLLLFAQMPRMAKMGQSLVCRVGLESVPVDGRTPSTLREVSWQLARGYERDWRVIKVSPPPDSFVLRNGRGVWSYRDWPADERWSLRLVPRARGRRVLAVIVVASDHYPVQRRLTVAVH